MSLEGLQLGQYRLIRLLGSGGMGEVYLAEDERIGQQVAMKVSRTDRPIYQKSDEAQDTIRLFQREARAIARLDHPQILPLYSYGEERLNGTNLTYLVMPYRPEGSFLDWLQQRNSSEPLSLQDVAYFIEQAADALQYAHDKQIIHQDVKPSNFMIRTNSEDPDHPDLLLADFGIAKLSNATSHTSLSVRGTPTYMAPEQWGSEPIQASDQYALAVMAYELLTGHPPFFGRPEQLLYHHLTSEPQPPGSSNPAIPSAVDTVILRALAKQPADRYPSIAEFAHAFQQAIAQAPSQNETLPALEGDTQNAYVTAPDSMAPAFALSHPDSVSTPQTNTQTANIPFSTSVQPSPSKSFPLKALLLVALVLLVIVGASISFFVFLVPHQHASISKHTGQTITITTTPRISRNTAPISGATATSTPSSENPYTHSGTLVLNDPLHGNSKGYKWEEGPSNQGSCTFTGGAYHASIPSIGYMHSCLETSQSFNNFAFEVQMNILSGHVGGIVFRANSATNRFYGFLINSNGDYRLQVYYNKHGNFTIIKAGSTALLTGNDLIAVVAQGNSISLYINRKFVVQVKDATSIQGQIGVVTFSGEAVFSNARVWKL